MQIYEPKSSVATLATNGIGSILCSSAVVHEEINGEFSIDITVPKASSNFDSVIGGAIVKADTPRGPQYFRLTKPVLTLDGGKQVFGWHISYDLAKDCILDTNLTAKTGAEAIALILLAGISERRFSGTSDITTVNNARIVRMSPLAALIGDAENAFRRRWGGEIERNNFTVNMKTQIGADNGFAIRYRKNLTGLTLEEDYDQIANRIIPSGLSDVDAPLLLPETYIDSPRISDTPVPCVKHVHYSDVKIGAKDKDGNILYADANAVYTELRARVAALYSAGADLPRITATVEFIDLSTTEEYKDYAILETVNLGDTVKCYHDELGINLIQRVVAYDYDALTKKYINITLGVLAPTIIDSDYARDIDLSALKNDMEGVVKQGSIYYGTSIDHTNGFMAEANIGGQVVKSKQNASAIGFFDASDNFKGGMAVINSIVAFIAGMLTNGLDSDCYATIGDIVEGGITYRGLFIYNKNVSTSDPVLRIITGAVTSGEAIIGSLVQLRALNGAQIWFGAGNTHQFIIRDPSGNSRCWINYLFSELRSPDGTKRLGVDNDGVYKNINDTKTYL
jgi:phage minor structural protein